MPTADLFTHPFHLGRAGSALIEPTFSGAPDWFMVYADRHAEAGPKAALGW